MPQLHDGHDGNATDIGRRQSLFREVNEQIDHLAERFDLLDEVTIICECGSTECHERIVLSHDEYESLRSSPTRFAVLAGHEIADVERIVEKSDRYIVVEKIGESAGAAKKLDPRRDSADSGSSFAPAADDGHPPDRARRNGG